MAEVKQLQQMLGQDMVSNIGGQGQKVEPSGQDSFAKMVEKGIDKLNSQMAQADKLAAELAAGRELDIPEVMVQITKADISFRMFVQMRNKALSAYEEIMRLQF